MLDQAVDVADLRSGTFGDAHPATAVDDHRLGAFLGRHRPDDRLDRLEVVVVDAGALEFLGDAGHHAHQIADRAHLLELLHLFEEVVERELTLEQSGGGLLGLVGLERLLGLLDQGHDVAHPENAARHPIGVELLELVELLARRGERDRSPDDLLDRQRGATSCVAVELRHDHAVDAQRLVERLGCLHGILAGHRIDHEERVVGVDSARDEAHLLHHLGVDREAAGGVDDQYVAPESLRLVEAVGRGEHRILGIGEHRHVDLRAEGAQLLDRGRTLQVGADEQRLAALALEPGGELGGGGRLAGAL